MASIRKLSVELLGFLCLCATVCACVQLALRNALRYFPPSVHGILAPEFAQELTDYGHIYMYRFIPSLPMKAYPFQEYPTRCTQAAGIMHMLMNNLDPCVAQVQLMVSVSVSKIVTT